MKQLEFNARLQEFLDSPKDPIENVYELDCLKKSLGKDQFWTLLKGAAELHRAIGKKFADHIILNTTEYKKYQNWLKNKEK